MLQRIPTLVLASICIFAGLVSVPVSAQEASMNKMLVGYWNFDKDSKDASGHKLDGTLSGAPKYIEGITGEAILLDGQTQQVSVPHNDLMNLTTYTVSMWIRSDAKTSYATLLRKGNDEQENYKLTLKYGNRPMSYMLGRDQKLQALVPKEAPVHTNQWHMVTTTFDGSTWKIYVDAKEIFSRTVSAGMTPQFNKEPLLIGNENNIYGRGFKGALDEVKLFNYALSAAEVEREYQKLLPDPSRANLVVHYDFEGGAVDLQKSGINGVVKRGTFKTGKVGRGVEFVGKDEYIEVPHNKRLAMDNFSVELWMNASAMKENNYIYSKGTPGQENFELMLGTRGELSGFIKFENGTRSWFRTKSGLIEEGKWYHIIQTFENNVYRIYVDGTMVYERVLFGKNLPVKKETPLFIGKKSIARDATFDGMIDELRIYNRALQPQEIARLRNQGTTNVIEARERELVGKWSLERSLEDASTHENDGKSPFANFNEGYIGKGLFFDDRQDGVRIPDSNSIDLDELSVAMWVKQDIYQNGRYLLSKGTGESANYALQTRSDGGLDATIRFTDGSTETLKSAPKALSVGNWHHVAMSYQPSSWKIVVDGKVVATSTEVSGIPQVNAIDLFIGNESYLGRSHFQGSIDEVYLYNYAINDDTLKALLNAEPTTMKETEDVATGALRNGDFERGLKDWVVTGQGVEESYDGLGGSKALLLKVQKGMERSITQKLGTLEAGKTYKISVAFKAKADMKAQLFFGDKEGPDPLDNVVTKYVEGNGIWKRIELTHTMTHADTMMVLLSGISSDSSTESGEILFDDLRIVEAE